MGPLIGQGVLTDTDYHYQDQNRPELPTTDHSHRPPQRNDANVGCHCECRCSSAGDDRNSRIANVHAQQDTDDENMMYGSTDDDDDGYDSPTIDGEEGAEEHLLELESHDFISTTLHEYLTRYRNGILPEPENYPFNSGFTSQSLSGFHSPQDSLIVELGSSDHSMTSSGSLSVYSRTESVLYGVGVGPSYPLPPFPVIWNPLRLTEEVRYEYPPEPHTGD